MFITTTALSTGDGVNVGSVASRMTFCVIDKLVIGRHTDTVTLSEECPLSCSTFFLFERVDAHGILTLNAHWCHHDRFEFCLTSPEPLMLLSSVATVFFVACVYLPWCNAAHVMEELRVAAEEPRAEEFQLRTSVETLPVQVVNFA